MKNLGYLLTYAVYLVLITWISELGGVVLSPVLQYSKYNTTFVAQSIKYL